MTEIEEPELAEGAENGGEVEEEEEEEYEVELIVR